MDPHGYISWMIGMLLLIRGLYSISQHAQIQIIWVNGTKNSLYCAWFCAQNVIILVTWKLQYLIEYTINLWDMQPWKSTTMPIFWYMRQRIIQHHGCTIFIIWLVYAYFIPFIVWSPLCWLYNFMKSTTETLHNMPPSFYQYCTIRQDILMNPVHSLFTFLERLGM